jgi:Uma2 family endonuclease
MGVLKEHSERFVTIEDYLAMEDESSEKHEYYNGKIVKMPGATPIHNIIAVNIMTQLNIGLEAKDKNYFVLNSDSKIYIPKLNHFVYPDAVVVCEQIELYPGSSTVITNPLLIVEVLSESTEEYDRGEKFHNYKRITSFKEYVLVVQKMPLVTDSFRINSNTWEDTEAEGLETSIYLRSLDISLDLRKIYKSVPFS